MKYEVIENFLNEEHFSKIKDIFSQSSFPWYYVDGIGTPEDKNRFHFSHMIYEFDQVVSNFFTPIALPILYKLSFDTLIRVKCNCFVKETENFKSKKHFDFKEPHQVCLYYVNTNNGYTLLDEKVKVPSVANSAVIFDGSIPHQAVSQTDEKVRINVNINFK